MFALYSINTMENNLIEIICIWIKYGLGSVVFLLPTDKQVLGIKKEMSLHVCTTYFKPLQTFNFKWRQIFLKLYCFVFVFYYQSFWGKTNLFYFFLRFCYKIICNSNSEEILFYDFDKFVQLTQGVILDTLKQIVMQNVPIHVSE